MDFIQYKKKIVEKRIHVNVIKWEISTEKISEWKIVLQ